ETGLMRGFLPGLAVILAAAPCAAAAAPGPAEMLRACEHGAPLCIVDLHGQRYRLTETLRIDPLHMTLRNGVLDAAGLARGSAAILVTSDGDAAESYDTAPNSLDHLELLGADGVDGIVFDNKDDSNIRAADLTVENVSVSGFRRGITFGNHAYGVGLSHMQVHNNEIGIYTVPHAVDAGERITFEDTGIFNNRIGIDDEGGMEIDWLGCRWDYNGTTAIIAGLFTFDGHIETEISSHPVIELRAVEGQIAGALYMSAGSFVLMNHSGGKAGGDYWISSTSPYNAVQFPASTYGVRGRVAVMQGPGAVYGPALPAFRPR
ncbi:hypothetical protein, partial [Acidomonas methanolica]